MGEKEKADFEEIQNQLQKLSEIIMNLVIIVNEQEKRIDIIHDILIRNTPDQTLFQ